MKRKSDDEQGNGEQAKRINFNLPPMGHAPPPLPPGMPPPMGMLPTPPQPDYFMGPMNGPWRGRGNPRGGQNFMYNNRGGQHAWRPRGGPNQRNFRGGPPGGFFRGNHSKGNNNQFAPPSFYGNPNFSNQNFNNNGPFGNTKFPAQGSATAWQPDTFVNQEESGGKNKGQGNHPSPGVPPDSPEPEGDAGSPKGSKRRAQSQPSRPWDREAAEKALALQLEHLKTHHNPNLLIRFPDPELNKDIVKAFHPDIANVHFQVPSGPRFCFVQLEEGTDVDKVVEALSSKSFGTGVLHVEKRTAKDEDTLSAESIDPYTLYIGNLPATVTVQTIREKFPTAARIDVGFAHKMKYTRYAFIKYHNADSALEAFRESQNLQMENRSVIVRFKKHRGGRGNSPVHPLNNKDGDCKAKQKSGGDVASASLKPEPQEEESPVADWSPPIPSPELPEMSKVASPQEKGTQEERDDEEEEEDDDDDEQEQDDSDDDDEEDDDEDEEEEEEEEEDPTQLPPGATCSDDEDSGDSGDLDDDDDYDDN